MPVLGECKVCGKMTTQRFNIEFKAVSVCENCEASIVMQSVTYAYRQGAQDKRSLEKKDDK